MMGNKRSTALVSIGLALVMGFSCAACMVSGFDLDVSLWVLAGWCLLTGAVCALCFCCKWRWMSLIPLGLLALILGYLWQDGLLGESLESLLNSLSEVYQDAYGWSVVQWSDRSARELAQTLPPIVYLLGVFAAFVTAWSVCFRRGAALAIAAAMIPVFTCFVVTDKVPDLIWLMALLYGIVMLVLTSATRTENEKQGTRLFLYSALPALLAVALLFAAIPREGYSKDRWAEDFYESISDPEAMRETWEKLWEALWGNEAPDIPVGDLDLELDWIIGDGGKTDLRKAGKRITNTARVMSVTAETSGVLYLRGSVMNTYIGTGWVYVEETESYSWPDEKYLVNAGDVKISTRNIHEKLYMPYYPLGVYGHMPAGLDNTDRLTDYTVGWMRLPNDDQIRQLYDSPYTNPEPYANMFSPRWDNSWSVDLFMEIRGNIRSYYHVAQLIGDYVRNSATYDTDTDKMPADRTDFVRWFLEESNTGYCVHFASAAAVLLKAAGIPARYVTGYMVDVKAGEEVKVTNANAHAWVEYWLPGFGWTILEATPAAAGSPIPPQTTPSTPATTPSAPTTPSTPATTPSAPTTAPTQPSATAPQQSNPGQTGTQTGPQPQNQNVRNAVWMTVLLWVGLVLLFFGLIFGQWRIRLLLHKRWRERGTVNQQVINRWREAVYLSRLLKTAPEPGLFELAQKAKFSQYNLEPEALEPLDRYIFQTQMQLRKHNIFRRCWYALVLAIF